MKVRRTEVLRTTLFSYESLSLVTTSQGTARHRPIPNQVRASSELLGFPMLDLASQLAHQLAQSRREGVIDTFRMVIWSRHRQESTNAEERS